MNKILLVSLMMTWVFPFQVTAQTLNDVPGSVVYWRTSPSNRFFGPDRIYTASPSIVRLDDGAYLISFNLFGASLSPHAEETGTTYIYRSTDEGASWTNLTNEPMMDMKRGSLFVHGGNVYIWGYAAAPGKIAVRRSTDNGTTWSAPTELTSNNFGGTPMNPVAWVNENSVERRWFAVGGSRLMSVRGDLDFLDQDAWSSVGSAANTNVGPFGDDLVVTEAQIVASPEFGVVLMPKVQMANVAPPYHSYTALIHREPDSNRGTLDPQDEDWVALPGGEKKFGAAYDPVSGRFFVLSNPVLTAHENNTGLTWQLIRNTAALLSSRDLRHWDVEQILLYSPNIDYEGFQYMNFDFDGDDLIIASRTAFDLTEESGVFFRPPRAHDSNMITFHRIPDFRNAVPNHFLTYSGNVVQRHEQTQHAAAPLGGFVLGSVFNGSPLGTVTGLAQADNKDVLIREESGRVLRFDALGNFVDTATEADGVFQTESLFIDQPAHGERTLISSNGGNWADLFNWYYWGRPDTDYEIANLGSAITSSSTLTLDNTYTMKGMRLRSTHEYNLAGGGRIVFEADTGKSILDVLRGSHEINVPVTFGNDTESSAQNGAELSLKAGLDLGGWAWFIEGGGMFLVDGDFVVDGGVHLAGGVLEVGSLLIEHDGFVTIGHGAKLVIAQGDVTSVVEAYVDDERIQVGDDLDPATWYIDYDYGVTTDGKTTVYAVSTIEPPECEQDEDCPVGYDCIAGSCREAEVTPDECKKDEDCPVGRVCVAGSCVDSDSPYEGILSDKGCAKCAVAANGEGGGGGSPTLILVLLFALLCSRRHPEPRKR